MTKQFSLLQLFSLVDGRLSTDMEDIYTMLNHICDEDLMTHHLSVAMTYLKDKNPAWFQEVKTTLEEQEMILDSKDFQKHMDLINTPGNNRVYDIPQLKDEYDTSDFGDYMINNSLLLKKLA